VRGGSRFRFAAALVVALCATSVFAQEGLRDRNPNIDEARNIANDLSRANFHNGPFYLSSSIELSDVGYNQSFFVPTSDQDHGFTFNVRAPNTFFFVPHKKVIFSVQATPSYAVLSQGNGRNQFGYFLRTDARLLLNHLFLDGYISRFDDLRANVGDINRLVTARQTDFGLRGELKYSSRTSLKGSAEYSKIAYPSSRLQPEAIPVDLLARDEHNYRVSGVHKTFPLTSLILAAERSDYEFDSARSSDSRRTYFGAGFDYETGRHSVIAEAGPARLVFKDPTQRDYRGILGSVKTSHRFSPLWNLTGSLSRDLNFSIFPNNPYFVTDRLASELSWNTTRKLTLHLLANYGRDRYQREFGGVFRHDTLEYIAVGWLYGTRYIAGGFDIGYFQRKSNSSLADQESGIRGTVRLSLRP
jgi:hypothetical protein